MRGECPNPKPDCPLARAGCASNTHHLIWPANRYTSPIEREFRELPENKVQMCVWEHNQLHREQSPPKKPKLEVMMQALAQISLQCEVAELRKEQI